MGDINKARKDLQDRLLFHEGIVGFGIGEKCGRLCIKVYVKESTQDLKKVIPETFGGFDVEVEVVGEVKLF